MNGLGQPGVLPPFLGLGTLPPSAYGGGLPGLGAFALTQAGQMNSQAQAALRGISNVLLISNLNEEVSLSFLLQSPDYDNYPLLIIIIY